MRPNNDIRVILVERDRDIDSSELGIFGKLYINGTYFCDTLENRRFAVPCGLYEVEYNDSPKFGRKLPMFFDRGNYDPSRGLRDVIRATEDGEVYVALAFLNGMLTAMTMGGKK